MSQSSQMASSQVSRQITELIDEIAFQRVLLSSIDDNVQDREDAEKDVRDEIRSLERQLRDLRRRTTTTALKSRSSNPSSQNLQATPSRPSRNYTANSLDGGHDKDAAEKTAMNGYSGEFCLLGALLSLQISAASRRSLFASSCPSPSR